MLGESHRSSAFFICILTFALRGKARMNWTQCSLETTLIMLNTISFSESTCSLNFNNLLTSLHLWWWCLIDIIRCIGVSYWNIIETLTFADLWPQSHNLILILLSSCSSPPDYSSNLSPLHNIVYSSTLFPLHNIVYSSNMSPLHNIDYSSNMSPSP